MADDSSRPGKRNVKSPDTDIQGVKAGERNRKSTADGVIPPPAGEAVAEGRDPRTETASASERRN